MDWLFLGSWAFHSFNNFRHSNFNSQRRINELKKYKKGIKLKVKILEINKEELKVRIGLKQLEKDPFEWFRDKKINDPITVQVMSSDNKGLMVKPEGSNLQFLIKKSQIAVSSADARPNSNL